MGNTWLMRLFLLTSVVMTAFAANSVLNRAALLAPEIAPLDFAWIRAASGALALMLLVAFRERALTWPKGASVPGALALAAYMTCFSMGYVTIDTGAGALILFAATQVTMFVGAVAGGEQVPGARWAGAAMALTGLAWLLWPAPGYQLPLAEAGLMVIAAIGWGIYSLIGQRAKAPLPASATSFVMAAPICVAAALILPSETVWTPYGLGLAILSGVVTSAMAYALWYAVLPSLTASVAGLSMITVPVIAFAGGVLFLGEPATLRFVLASIVVLGGLAIGVLLPQRTRPQRTSGSSGS